MILVTLYIVHTSFKGFLLYLFCIQIFIAVFGWKSFSFFIYRMGVFSFVSLFIDFYLWRVI